MAIIKNIIFDLGNVILKGTHMSIIKQYATNAEQMKFIEEEYLKAKECLFIDDDDTNQSYISPLEQRSEAVLQLQNFEKRDFFNSLLEGNPQKGARRWDIFQN